MKPEKPNDMNLQHLCCVISTFSNYKQPVSPFMNTLLYFEKSSKICSGCLPSTTVLFLFILFMFLELQIKLQDLECSDI